MTNLEKNMKIFTIVLVLIGTINIIPQIDTTRKEFFPLQIGNIWQYRDENNFLNTTAIKTDTLLDGKKYYIRERVSLRTQGGIAIRVDSLMRVQNRSGFPTEGDTCGGNNPYEWSIYHLAESDSAVWEICDHFNGMLTFNPLVRFNKIKISSIFGQPREVMQFDFGGQVIDEEDTTWNYGARLVRGIGIIEERYYEGEYSILQGAIINGIQYGNIVSVEGISGTVPNEIILYQNYPNPFNPSTTIKYSIKESGLVTLKVFDVLGKEVADLVNEVKPAGVYEIEFNAIDLPSGVYIYSLRVNDFVSNQKMLLLK